VLEPEVRDAEVGKAREKRGQMWHVD